MDRIIHDVNLDYCNSVILYAVSTNINLYEDKALSTQISYEKCLELALNNLIIVYIDNPADGLYYYLYPTGFRVNNEAVKILFPWFTDGRWVQRISKPKK